MKLNGGLHRAWTHISIKRHFWWRWQILWGVAFRGAAANWFARSVGKVFIPDDLPDTTLTLGNQEKEDTQGRPLQAAFFGASQLEVKFGTAGFKASFHTGNNSVSTIYSKTLVRLATDSNTSISDEMICFIIQLIFSYFLLRRWRWQSSHEQNR